MKYNEILRKYENLARQEKKETSAIKMLLLHASNLETSVLYASLNTEMEESKFNHFEEMVNKYLYNNIPVQHLIGYDYFYGYKFVVNENVLIPRFETEELVQNVLMYYDEVFEGEKVDVVDIGTGSGAIAISLALEEPNMNVLATDISKEALETAIINNENNGGKVKFLHGDMLEPLKGMKFDILVSNPPYIPSEEYVEPLVKDNEPHVALFGGIDGLYFYRIILSGARELLKDKFIIAFEHAYNTGEQIVELAKEKFPDCEVILLKDMQQKNRMTFILKR